MSRERPPLLFELEEKPPLATCSLAGLQHLLAVFGGIVTAPLIIASGMKLAPADVNYLVTSALLVSGIATLIQISRLGIVGSGLLSIQGTSFTFIAPLLFCFSSLPLDMPAADKLATLFGTSAVAALLMLPIVFHIDKLRRLFTPAVSGATVMLLGLTLVWTTGNNLSAQYLAVEPGGGAWKIPALAILVFLVTLTLAFSRSAILRMSSITAGLAVGFTIASLMGQVDLSALDGVQTFFVPVPFKYGVGFDASLLLILLPVFLVSVTESMGDLTATSALSGLPVTGSGYWNRLRGGLLGDSLNSFIAAVFATFPNTTFSQNNGVIRLTGIASRRVGIVVAGLLILLGLFPVVAALFQTLPSAIVYGATMLMFLMVGFSGISILQHSNPDARAWAIAGIAVIAGPVVSLAVGSAAYLPAKLQILLSFPVSTGALIAIVLELVVPADRASPQPRREPVHR